MDCRDEPPGVGRQRDGAVAYANAHQASADMVRALPTPQLTCFSDGQPSDRSQINAEAAHAGVLVTSSLCSRNCQPYLVCCRQPIDRLEEQVQIESRFISTIASSAAPPR